MKYKFKSAVILSYILLPIVIYGQSMEHVLNGYVHVKDAETCKYQVAFKISGTKITGYSITTEPDGQDLRAAINGSIDRKRHTMSFTESDLAISSPNEACLFDAKLGYRLQGTRYLISGDFTGRDIKNNYCGEGLIELTDPVKPSFLFEKDKSKKRAATKQDTVDGDNTAPLAFTKVTSGGRQKLDWKTDTCTLEIWDGEVVDGDIVTIMLNNKKILEHYSLLAEKKLLRLPLTGKISTLRLIAENEGKAPPNTAQLMLRDGNLRYGLLVCLETGKSAEIILKKK